MIQIGTADQIAATKDSGDGGYVPVSELTPFNACCCSIVSLVCDLYKCIGVYADARCLCLDLSMKCCRASDVEDKCCILADVESSIMKPKSCVRFMGQCFCYDIRCALPCEAEVPCMFTVCFLTLFYDYACNCAFCNRVGDFSNPETDATRA